MFAPGIPQVYYNGLLAGKNDFEAIHALAEKVGGWGRDLNRHNYDLNEAEKEFEKPVVKRLLKLMEFRSECLAFDGELEVLESDSSTLNLIWKNQNHFAKAVIDLKNYKSEIEYTKPSGEVVSFVS
jgi:sucrose phosphorylase